MSDKGKYRASRQLIEDTRHAIRKLEGEYVNETLQYLENADFTPNQIKAEFWQMIAAFYGFEIVTTQAESKGEG